MFDDARAGTQVSAFVQSTLRFGDATLNAGLRHDEYRFLVNGRQLQPRLGVAYRVPGRDIVLRASYNRNYQTPPNENLLLSNSEAASRLAPASVREALGGAYRPIRPERQDVYEVGCQGRSAAWRRRRVGLPEAVARPAGQQQLLRHRHHLPDHAAQHPRDRRRGAAHAAAAPRLSGLAERHDRPRHLVAAVHGRAVPRAGRRGSAVVRVPSPSITISGSALHGTLTYDPAGPWWVGGSIRYDSGLVSNPSDPAEVAADPDFADLLPYVNLEADTPRVRPRTIVDAGGRIRPDERGGRRNLGRCRCR